MDKSKGGAGLALLVKMGKKKPMSDSSDEMGAGTDDSQTSLPSDDASAGDSMGADKMGGGSDKADMAADDAFEALQSGDRDGFRQAFRNAVRACMDNSY